MSSRDFRASALKKISSGEIGAIESLVYGIYASISHGRILAHSNNPEKLGSKIISIGNITFGGSGKTPLVEYFARHFALKDVMVGVASPGYKGKARDAGVLVSDGNNILCGIDIAGDEALMLAKNLLELKVPVYAHRNRIMAAKKLEKSYNCRVVIMDDAFHFTSVIKDADICLVDALNPFGGGALFARGLLREPPDALSRAHAIIVTNRVLIDDNKYSTLENRIRSYGFKGSIFNSAYMPARIECIGADDVSLNEASGLKVIPVSGIGNPEAFEKSLRVLGISFGEAVRFNDHHFYTPDDARMIKSFMREDKAEGIITTSKDWERFANMASILDCPIYVLHSEVYLDEECVKWLEQRLGL